MTMKSTHRAKSGGLQVPCFGLLPHMPSFWSASHDSFWLWGSHDGQPSNDDVAVLSAQAENNNNRPPLYLLDIIGARGLPNETVDSFVQVSLGDQVVHTTATIWNDANPIWTINTKSLFLLRIPAFPEKPGIAQSHVNQDGGGLPSLSLEKYYNYNKDDCVVFELFQDSAFPQRIGSAFVPCQVLIQAAGTGERMERPLLQRVDEPSAKRATFAFRMRLATADDVTFLGEVVSSRNSPHGYNEKVPTAADLDFHHVHDPRSMFDAIATTNATKVDSNGQILRRIQPYHPKKPLGKKHEWMSDTEIEMAVKQHSSRWVTAGNLDSAVAVLQVEILQCHNLPVMDFVSTDSVAMVVVEDVAVRTDIIWNELNPQWPHWSVRAFAIAVQSLESPLFVALFDYDETPLDDHDPMGRIVLKPTSFQPGLTYTLVYPLITSSRGNHDNKDEATLTLRLKVEWKVHDERSLLTAPPRSILNCRTLKTFRIICYTVHGPMDEPSVTSIKLLWNEILSYKSSIYFALDVWLEIFLWRGRISLGGGHTIWFPLRSIILFLWVMLLIELPHKGIPLILLGVSGLLLCIHYHSSHHPLPWRNATQGVWTVVRKMIVGRSPLSLREIAAYEGVAEDVRLAKLDDLKAKRMEALFGALMGFASKAYKIYSSGSVVVTTDRKMIWNLFSGHLSPVYNLLFLICMLLRFVRSFLTWQSALTAKITTYTLLVAGMWLVLPMNQVLQWSLRIMSWVLLGPWIKWLDDLYFRSWYETKCDLLQRIDSGQSEEPLRVPNFDQVLNNETFCKLTEKGRILVEDLCKLRDMRSLRFGSYSTKVPTYDNSRTQSIPMPKSTAEIMKDDEKEMEVMYHLPGQRLHGSMIYTNAWNNDQRNV